MRLTKIKVAGFKSFADPTSVGFPSNLTGVVGPNGCGKSNIIDAVRWVMGELSAKHLRGDSMVDVIFNGSASRKPVGTASVELVFDNSDGKISGPYADYTEVSLKRQVTRDGTSNYFLNGARCRRKDITQLFLGTGLGSRSYAIIEQGMISRVIEAKADDMRMFVEEAAGISRYKERRKETEARISDTRENLERLQDVRDEVDKQIRHLQRQAATARRYQALKETERRLTAELLALRLREIDSGAEVQDSAVRECELTMQHALADQRAAEAAIETQRVYQTEQSDRVSSVQARYYEVGAEISRTEQSITHTRELREQQRNELAQARATLAELDSHIQRDERQIEQLRAEIAQLGPDLAQAQAAESSAERGPGGRRARDRGLATALGRFQPPAGRRAPDHAGGACAHRAARKPVAAPVGAVGPPGRRARSADGAGILGPAGRARAEGIPGTQHLRRAFAGAERRARSLAETARRAVRGREPARGGTRRPRKTTRRGGVARSPAEGGAGPRRFAHRRVAGGHRAWRPSRGSRRSCRVRGGWERAVETALGDYLEALCVDELDAVADVLPSLPVGRISLLQVGEHLEADDAAGMLSGVVSGPAAIVRLLSRVRLAETLAEALQMRRELVARRIGDHALGRVDRSRLAARQSRRRSPLGRARARAAPQAVARRPAAQRRKRARHGSRAGRLPRIAGPGRARARRGAEPHPGGASRACRPARAARRRAGPRAGVDRAARTAGRRGRGSHARNGSRTGRAGARARRAGSRPRGAGRARFTSRRSRERARGAPRSGADRTRPLAGGTDRQPRPVDPHRIASLERKLDGSRSASAWPISAARPRRAARSSRRHCPTAISPSWSWNRASGISSHAASTWRASWPPSAARSRKPTERCASSTRSA